MLLHTEQLTKDYGRFRALERLDLGVQPGEVFGLLGPNGSGKTTALRVFLGFLQPTSGRAWIDRYDCWRDSVAARRLVAYLPGELRLYENMTGRQLLRFLADLRQLPATADVNRLAQRLDLDLDRPIAHLSSGMKRKLALLQVLVPRVPLLILDEPTNTLDPTMRDELLALLRQARDQGQAVLFSSHVLGEVEQVCDRVGILQRGRLVHLQEMAHLREAKRVEVRFTGPVGSLPEIEGLQVIERRHDWVCFELRGPLAPLIAWLTRQSLRDLNVRPLGLTRIYQRYHGNYAHAIMETPHAARTRS